MSRPNEICRKCEGRTCHEPLQCHGYPQASEQADRIRASRLCPECGIYPAQGGGACDGCVAYREHLS